MRNGKTAKKNSVRSMARGISHLNRAERKALRGKPCAGCESNFADPPSRLCPGCQAYREHQQ